jgi:membrane protein DedA with SNARE-associated domain
MELVQTIQAHHWQGVAYVILFCGMLFEATFFLFVAMILLAQHALNPAATIAIVAVGAFAEEILWYYIGLSLDKWKWLSDWTNRVAKPIDNHLITRPFNTLMLSKFVYGVHRAVLTRYGMIRMPVKRFMKNAFASTGIWLALVGSLGYSLGVSYNVFRRYIGFAELIPLIIVIVYFVFEYYLSKRLKRSL